MLLSKILNYEEERQQRGKDTVRYKNDIGSWNDIEWVLCLDIDHHERAGPNQQALNRPHTGRATGAPRYHLKYPRPKVYRSNVSTTTVLRTLQNRRYSAFKSFNPLGVVRHGWQQDFREGLRAETTLPSSPEDIIREKSILDTGSRIYVSYFMVLS